jgi:hypothetical protein
MSRRKNIKKNFKIFKKLEQKALKIKRMKTGKLRPKNN